MSERAVRDRFWHRRAELEQAGMVTVVDKRGKVLLTAEGVAALLLARDEITARSLPDNSADDAPLTVGDLELGFLRGKVNELELEAVRSELAAVKAELEAACATIELLTSQHETLTGQNAELVAELRRRSIR